MNINDYTLKVTYRADGEIKTAEKSDNILTLKAENSENRVKITVKAAKRVELLTARLIYKKSLAANELFFGNGFQSWTTSREYGRGDSQKGIRFPCSAIPLARTYAGSSGDYHFVKYGKGLFHSHTYTYFRNGSKTQLIGTLNDRTGYTVFYEDVNNGSFTASKDVEGLVFEGEYELFNLISFSGTYDEVFDAYFEAYPEKATGRVRHMAGYTSWYNYFQNINEEIILRDLEGLYSKVGEGANIFQIDDGYESKVGDWLTVDSGKFPHGMKSIAENIHADGYTAGIWIAPFSAEYKSRVVAEHPEWLIKNKKGKTLVGGFAWNGFYVLDFYIPEVREYISHFFDVILNEWNYDMVKLDFLYSEAIEPRNGKTRGQIMHEAMDFLRECCGDKLILGCGAPLGASWGRVDACRISCDVELSFKDRYYVSITNQEIISAKNAMNNSIFRRHLNGRIFANDPDVFFLRDDGMKSAKFTFEQKKLLARINHIFGSVLFVSDNIASYDEKKLAVLKNSYKEFGGKIISAEYEGKDTIAVTYSENGVTERLTFNTLTGENKTEAVNGG